MKHLNYLLLLICAFSYCACSSLEEDAAMKIEPVTPYLELATKIDSIPIDKNISRGTTSRPFFKKWLRTVLADALSGNKSINTQSNANNYPHANITVSAGGSIMSYKKYLQKLRMENLQYYSKHRIAAFPLLNDSTFWGGATSNLAWSDSLLTGSPTLIEPIQHGYIHNKIIADLYMEHGDSLFLYSPLKVDTLLRQELSSSVNLQYQSPDVMAPTDTIMINNILDICDASENLDECFTGLIDLYPYQRNELIVLRSIMDKLYMLDIETDQGEFFSNVLSLLRFANIPDSSKYIITSSLSIANASIRLWNLDGDE